MSAQLDIFQTEIDGLRDEVLKRHRGEWAEVDWFRRSALSAMREAQDFSLVEDEKFKKDISKDAKKARTADKKELWIIAKLAADTAKSNIQALGFKQVGERAAYSIQSVDRMEVITQPGQKYPTFSEIRDGIFKPAA